MTEQWKDIPDYEGIYQASNLGQIRTHKDKVTFTKRHGNRHWKQRILKPKGNNTVTGHRVTLWFAGKPKDYLVSRLVCTTFHENLIDSKMTVNHKDGNRLNNHIDNLEWLSRGDNIRHAFENNLAGNQKHVKITNKNTGHETYHRSFTLGAKEMGKVHGFIGTNLRKGRNENKDYKWEQITWEQYKEGTREEI